MCAEVHRLHHLSQSAVCQDHTGHTVDVRQVKGLPGEGCHLLHGVGCQNDDVLVAVTQAADGLVIVGLSRLNTAQTGAASLDVYQHAGQVTADDVGDTLAHQGHAGRGGGGDATAAGCGGTVDHVDGGDFTLCLQAHAVSLGQLLCHIFRKLGLRGDGVAEEQLTAGADGGFCQGFVTLH